MGVAIALYGVMDIVYFIYYLSHHSYTNLCYKVSITLRIFLHILLDHVLRTISLRVPTIPNPVGVVRGPRSEFQTWYRKVKGDDVASAYVLHPL